MISKEERLKIFIERLNAAVCATNDSDALELLSSILNAVEDEFTSTPYLPEQWDYDGRMYPPQEDSKHFESSNISRYRSRNHNTFIASNGAIKIVSIRSKEVLIDKPGKNGKRIGDL